jgi:hypothetical protein
MIMPAAPFTTAEGDEPGHIFVSPRLFSARVSRCRTDPPSNARGTLKFPSQAPPKRKGAECGSDVNAFLMRQAGGAAQAPMPKPSGLYALPPERRNVIRG